LCKGRAADQFEQQQYLLNKIINRLDCLYDAIADGLRTPGLKSNLQTLSSEKAAPEKRLSESKPADPILPPNLSHLYRSKVDDLHTAVSGPATRTQAADILRTLIDRIDIKTDENGTVAEPTGDIINLITLPEGSDVPVLFESSVKVVAGQQPS
jgi:hypothetical protein